MLDRRHVLATLAAGLLIAGAILVPQAFTARPGYALESTSASGPIPSAIDAGAAGSLAGLLPTSEAYQRVSDVIDGLKSGVPSSAPSLSTSQLDDIKAIAEGAAQGALASSPDTTTSSNARAALHALAAGYMRGALSQIASAPSAGRAAVDEAATKGLFAGASGLFVTTVTFVPASTWDEYAYTLANGLFDGLDDHAALLASATGSPAIGDITFFSTSFARASLADVPVGITKQQVDAVATFAAGALDGTIAGTVTSFPSGMPLPAQSDVSRWLQALATGHDGTPPWQKPGSLPLLLAWGDAVGAAAIEGIAQARANVTGATPPGSLDDLAAWADGLTGGGFTRLQSLAGYTPEIASDARAYAEALTAPGVAWITGFAHPNADPDVVKAWAFGLTGGLTDLVASTPRAFGLTDDYLSNLTSAITSFPPTVGGPQALVVQNYAQGVTSHLSARMTNVSSAAVSDQDPTIIGAMAQGIADDAVKFASGVPLSDPQLAQALGDGISSGFLQSTNPSDLWNSYDGLNAAVRAWIDSGPPASLPALNDFAQGAVRDPYYAAQKFGSMIGQAPLDWASAKGENETGQSFGAVEDLFWLQGFTTQFVTDLGSSFGSPSPTPDPGVDAVMAYAKNVSEAAAVNRHVLGGVHNITSHHSDFRQHASAFADFLSAPASWLAADPSKASAEAAQGVLTATVENATNVERFTDSDYAAAAVGAILALKDGLSGHGPSGPDVPPWAAGVTEAILTVPSDAVVGDISARLHWIETMSSVVPPIAHNATHVEYHAIKEFAYEATSWALGEPGRIPSPNGLPTPMITWAMATVGASLGQIPPVMTSDEENATVAYLMGIQTAITSLPPPDPANWTDLDISAIVAYVGGISSGVDRIANDTHTYLCTASEIHPNFGNVPGNDCPAPPDNGGGGGAGGGGGDCGADPCPPTCGPDCEASNWANALNTWANAIVAGGLDQLQQPDVTPTKAGVQLVADWAGTALAEHGVCPKVADPDLTCVGPRGPLVDFANEEHDRIVLAAQLVSEGAGALVSYQPDPNHPIPDLGALNDPILSWANGLTTAIPAFVQNAPNPLPGATGAPNPSGVTPPPQGDITDPAYRAALSAWAQALWQAPGEIYTGAFPNLPDTEGINATFADLQDFFAQSIWKGGGDAILDSPGAIEAFGRQVTPNASLDAWAQGLAAGVKSTLIDPTPDDINALLSWYAGLAHGGIDAIMAGAGSIQNGQSAALQAYATAMGQAYTPPAPQFQELDGLTQPGDPQQDVGNITSDGGDNNPPPPPPPPGESKDEYLLILQADAQGLAESALHAPDPGSLAKNATAYQAQLLTYVTSIVQAASALPQASPDSGFPARLSAWVSGESNGALSKPAPTSADRIGPSPNVALAVSYVAAFANVSSWNLDNASSGASGWASAAIAAGLNAACPPGDSASACATAGAALGQGLGTALPHAIPSLGSLPSAQELSFVSAIATSALPVLPTAPPGVGAEAVIGLTMGLAQSAPQAPNAAAAAQATMDGVGPTLDKIPFVAVRPTVQGIVEVLARSQDPARYQALAAGAAQIVVSMGDAANDPAAIQQAVSNYLATGGSGEPTVSASDGSRTRAGDALDGSAILDGQKPITITAYPSSSSPIDATWELRWSTGDPSGAGARTIAMSGSKGTFSATLAPDMLSSLARGAKVQFALAETRAGSTAMHTRGAAPFAFLPDRDAPNATISASLANPGIGVSWAGTDGDSAVASYQIESRDGAGAWATWVGSTSDPSGTFSGSPGHSYAFRVTPMDAVGHAGAAIESAAIAIPASAPADRAPTITINAPATGATFGKSIPVSLSASDPDGTTPIVKVCLRKEGATSDLSCGYEGKPATITLDASKLTDGRYRVHAIATDGSMSAEAMSASFAIDRTPPIFRGALADPSASGVLLSASLDRDATGVTADVAGRTVALADDGKTPDARAGDGIWTGAVSLAPGDYIAIFRAHDANGNEATLSKDVVVPAPLPTPPKGTGGGSTPSSPPSTPPSTPPPTSTATPPAKKGTPPIGIAPALVALAALALALRRRR